MYNEYSIINVNAICVQRSLSVLSKLPEVDGAQLVTSLIRPLISSGNSNSTANAEWVKCLQDDKDVYWIMEVFCYGLSLPLSDNDQYEAVRACVNFYHDWFQILSPNLSVDKNIPFPIKQDPNVFCQKIIGHLYNIFLPRNLRNHENITDSISRQAMLCHRILRCIIAVVTDKDNSLNAATWECLLIFLLGINEELLKSYVETNDIGTQMAERVITSLFQSWLASCNYVFPSPSLWKTLQSVCIRLRHQPELVIQWNRVNVCLSQRLVYLLYNSETASDIYSKTNFTQYCDIIITLKDDVLKQCWYRFLHIVGNPIELCFPELVFKCDPSIVKNSTCYLPFIFHKAIKGLSTLVDIFLGLPNIKMDDLEYDIPKISYNTSSNQNVTPPEKRKSNFSLLKPDKQNHPKTNPTRSSTSLIDHSNNRLPSIVLPSLQGSYYQNHIKLTSILDIFGKWLFQASLICSPNNAVFSVFETSLSGTETSQLHSLRRSFSKNNSFDEYSSFFLDDFEAGQAEAIGALCRIFCFKKEDDDVSPVPGKHSDFLKIKNYLTSYYLSLKFALSHTNEQIKRQLLSSILVNCVCLFEVDLPGSKILIPHFLKCIEIFVAKKDKNNSPSDVLIRRACIKIIISLLSYPLHYKSLPIKDTLNDSCNTFISLYPRLILLLIWGLFNENDSTNIQMILGALLFVIEDSINYAELFSVDNLKDSANYDLAMNLATYFRIDYQFSFEKGSDLDKSEITSNLFLLIISFVAEVLCKTSLKNINYNVSLTALEVLSALGRVHYNQQLLCSNRCKTCIKQISLFIENQCNKPAMYHSKDMHSAIVAAYQCLSVWINEHLHLLRDKECILLLFELIELGISGSKSKKDGIVFKSDKILKPTSMRVREAAEFLLTTLMGRIDLNVSASLSDSIQSCDLNESKIFEHMLQMKPLEYPSNHFRYFIAENSLLISILDKPLQNEETICIIRSPYGKYCWLLKYQHLSNKYLPNLQNETIKAKSRSVNKVEQIGKSNNVNYFPDYFDKMCQSKYDNMVLKLSNYINELNDLKQEYQIMHGLVDEIETNLSLEKSKLNLSYLKKDFQEPSPSNVFEAHRLFLSQFKIFNFDVQNNYDDSHKNLIALNNHSQGFIDCLNKLDMISTKNNDFVLIFYIPKAFKDESEILNANLNHSTNNFIFKEFLSSLGCPIAGKSSSNSFPFFYWNDVSHELVFMSPCCREIKQELTLSNVLKEDNETLRKKLLKYSLNGDSENDKIKSYLLNNTGCDIKVLVLWMESMEDFNRLPIKMTSSKGENTTECDKLCIIIINPLKNGLYRVFPHSLATKYTSVSPIVDRMILGKHLLGAYIRVTALNLFRRRRMNVESFQLPHVKRRMKIQEMINKFKMPYTNKELICDLFRTKFL